MIYLQTEKKNVIKVMKKFKYLNEELLYFLHCHTTIAFKLYNLVLHIDDFFSDGAL